MITTFYPPYNLGGDGIFVYRLSNELAQRGHYVEVIHCVDAYNAYNTLSPSGSWPHHANVKVHSLKSRLGLLSPLLTHQTGHPLLKKKKLERILADTNFDVIHFHNVSLIGGPGVLQLGKAIKLFTVHEHWLICPLSVLWKFNKEACDKKNCLLCTVHAKRPPQLWRYGGMLKEVTKHIDAFIAPSQFTIDKHREMGVRIPFVQLDHFLPRACEYKTDVQAWKNVSISGPYFLFVGRLEKSKGIHFLVDIFKGFQKGRLVIVGDGTLKKSLKKSIKKYKNIRLVGQLPPTELPIVYQNATAVIVPSLCYETFGLVALEAFALRIPVIVSNKGALPEIIEHSGGGSVFNDASELLSILEKLLASPALCREMGERGYAAYRSQWTVEHHFEKYFSLISSLSKREINA